MDAARPPLVALFAAPAPGHPDRSGCSDMSCPGSLNECATRSAGRCLKQGLTHPRAISPSGQRRCQAELGTLGREAGVVALLLVLHRGCWMETSIGTWPVLGLRLRPRSGLGKAPGLGPSSAPGQGRAAALPLLVWRGIQDQFESWSRAGGRTAMWVGSWSRRRAGAGPRRRLCSRVCGRSSYVATLPTYLVTRRRCPPAWWPSEG